MRTKKSLLVIVSSLLVFFSFPLTPLADKNHEQENTTSSGKFSTKDEVIYGKLSASGNIKNMYVVNSFYITKPGEITDYGNYTNIRNLTDLSNINDTKDGEINFHAKEETFYYQGELEGKLLPWDISITYLLNGKEMKPEELAGKSGDLEIQLTTSANENVDPMFFEYYMLQISLQLDPLIFHDIQAPKGTEANEGKNKLITFSVMPEQEEVLILSAHVQNLKMAPIDISAIPANLAMEDPDIGDMKGDMKTLADAISEIHSGVSELKNGISELSAGSSELGKGSSEYLNGIHKLGSSSDDLLSGSEEILNVLKQISGAIEDSPELPDLDMNDLKNLPKTLRDIAKRLRELATNFNELNQAIGQIPDYTITEKQIKELEKAIQDSNANSETLHQLVEMYHAVQAVTDINDSTPNQLKALTEETASYIELIANEMEDGMASLEQLGDLDDLQHGLATLSSEYQSFHNGLVDYTGGVNSLATSYGKLHEGIEELSDGATTINQGISKLYEGTNELQKETSDLPSQMESEIDKFMDEFDFSDFEPTSFASSQNENIGVVQFVLQTESIEIEEVDTNDEKEEEKKSFWDRLLDLFK